MRFRHPMTAGLLIGAAAVLMATAVLAIATKAHAALVGTFTEPGQTIVTPLAFKSDVFNSVQDIQGGLQFAIADGRAAPVKLEILSGTENVTVVAAALENAFGISRTLPLSITTPNPLGPGVHPFAIGAVTSGATSGAIIARLTLTPSPPALLLLASGVAVLGWNFARRPAPSLPA